MKQKIFPTNGARAMRHHVQKMNLDTNLTSFTKINSKWITDPNVKCKTTKIKEDNIGENLDDLGFVDNFLGKTPNAQFMNERIDKLYLIKIFKNPDNRILFNTKMK